MSNCRRVSRNTLKRRRRPKLGRACGQVNGSLRTRSLPSNDRRPASWLIRKRLLLVWKQAGNWAELWKELSASGLEVRTQEDRQANRRKSWCKPPAWLQLNRSKIGSARKAKQLRRTRFLLNRRRKKLPRKMQRQIAMKIMILQSKTKQWKLKQTESVYRLRRQVSNPQLTKKTTLLFKTSRTLQARAKTHRTKSLLTLTRSNRTKTLSPRYRKSVLLALWRRLPFKPRKLESKRELSCLTKFNQKKSGMTNQSSQL